MKTVYGSAVTPNGICGFGYVDEGLPKEQALAKLKAEMQNNTAFQYFLSTLPKKKTLCSCERNSGFNYWRQRGAAYAPCR